MTLAQDLCPTRAQDSRRRLSGLQEVGLESGKRALSFAARSGTRPSSIGVAWMLVKDAELPSPLQTL